MRSREVLVEVPFTSNAQILGVTGKEHPFDEYFVTYGVPTAFATDDQGVSYATYPIEWVYAVIEYKLSLEQLIVLARNSLQYSFVPGDPLWIDVSEETMVEACREVIPGAQSVPTPCQLFLDSSQKATLQWRHESALAAFMQTHGQNLRELTRESDS